MTRLLQIGLVALALLGATTTSEARLNDAKNDEPDTHRQLQRLTAEEEIEFYLNPTIITIPGDNGFPAYAYPLGLCEGDCDDDTDCQDGFVCAQRRSNEPLPGCLFSPDPNSNATIEDSNDLCIPPPVVRARLEFGGNDGEPADAFPLSICQADCDGDEDCEGGLVCLDREEEGDAVSIYCEGAPFNDEDYCVPPAGTVPPIPGVDIPALTNSISGFPAFVGEELSDLDESIFLSFNGTETLITEDGNLTLTTITTSISKRALAVGEASDVDTDGAIDTINQFE